MFNLLPEQQKQLLRKEYRRRRLLVIFRSGVGLAVFALIALVPLYIMSSVESRAIRIEQQELSATSSAALKESVVLIDSTKRLVTVVHSTYTTTPLSFVIEGIVKSRPTGIKLSNIAYAAGEKAVIRIDGTASDRETLRTFARMLDDTKLFAPVVVPVSSFAQNANITFSLDIKMK